MPLAAELAGVSFGYRPGQRVLETRTWKNLPSDYVFPISDIRASVGAGFLYPLAGDFPLMPGVPSHPAAMDIDVDAETGTTKGLF